jgi:hypothetical protein
MALINFCGFENGDLTEAAASSGTLSVGAVVTPRSGDYCLRVNPTTTATGIFNLNTYASSGASNNISLTTLWASCWFRVETLPSADSEECFATFAASSVRKLQFRITSTGTIDAYNADGTTLLASGTTVLSTGVWYRVEWKCGIESGGGSNAPYELKINGVSEYSGTNGVLGTGNCAVVRLGKVANRNGRSIDLYYDDLILDDADYPSTTLSTTAKVIRLDPNDAGNTSGWTGSYTDVDDVPHDSDTTYISTSTSAAAHTVALEDAATAGITGTVHAVKSQAIAREEPSVTSALNLRLRSNTTDNDTANLNLSTSYAMVAKVYTTDPATSSAWALSALDSVQVGVEANAAVEHRCTMLCAMVLFTPASNANTIQGVTKGQITLSGLNTRDLAEFRTRLVQGVTTGELRLLGLVPDQIKTEAAVVNAYIQEVVSGLISIDGAAPQDLVQRVASTIQGITTGQIQFNGLNPQDLSRVSVAYIQGVDPGLLQILGLTPQDAPTGVAITGKSAASKLGLGNYSSVDVWSTPFSDYTKKFTGTVRPKPQVEVDISVELAKIQLLELQIQELQQSVGKIQEKAALRNMMREKREAERQYKQVTKKLQKLRHEYLLSEDEELLILLFS